MQRVPTHGDYTCQHCANLSLGLHSRQLGKGPAKVGCHQVALDRIVLGLHATLGACGLHAWAVQVVDVETPIVDNLCSLANLSTKKKKEQCETNCTICSCDLVITKYRLTVANQFWLF